MSSNPEFQNSSKIKIQTYSQSLVNQNLLLELESLNKAFQQEIDTDSKYEDSLSQLSQNYTHFMASSQTRETLLLAKLEQKDQELGEKLNELQNIKKSSKQILEQKTELQAKLQQLKSSELIENQPVLNTDNTSETFQNLLNEFEKIEKQWKESGEDVFEENIQKTHEFSLKITELQQSLKESHKKSQDFDSEKENLERKIEELRAVKQSKQSIVEKIEESRSELSVLGSEYESLTENYKSLSEKFENCLMDKDLLFHKYEKVEDMLKQEKKNSAQSLDSLKQENEINSSLNEKLNNEKQANEKLSESVIQDKISISMLREQLMKTKDLDTILNETLKKLNMEGFIKKIDEGYLYNNTLLNLSIHNENFVVVKIGGGLIPLTDFLAPGYLPSKNSKQFSGEPKTENMSDFCKEKRMGRSPIKPLQENSKLQKTPLRDRNLSTKKKPFK